MRKVIPSGVRHTYSRGLIVAFLSWLTSRYTIFGMSYRNGSIFPVDWPARLEQIYLPGCSFWSRSLNTVDGGSPIRGREPFVATLSMKYNDETRDFYRRS